MTTIIRFALAEFSGESFLFPRNPNMRSHNLLSLNHNKVTQMKPREIFSYT